jgi:copper oxidase (laccase) domain-containing protein
MQWETFAPLDRIDFITHAFTLRTDDDTRADDYEGRFVRSFGFEQFVRAGQPHGNDVAVVQRAASVSLADADALATRVTGLPLVIRCADCAAVFIVDQATPAIALIHSGKAGTKANVAGNTVQTMKQAFRTTPADCVAVISPSIGPCHYEMDIWAGIEEQLRNAGVSEIHNPRMCTACHLDRYYSYRAERGNTGRMLALLALR